MLNHYDYMQRCLQLAYAGQQWVAPNPMVGSVIVHNEKIIGEGFHEFFGGPHAEVNAIKSVQKKELLKDSVLYVNLEPCAHFGKTPPCANLIIENKISKVVIACLDPNPLVAGKGVELLKASGIEVEVGILEKEAIALNKRFIHFHLKKRPYITLKWAQTKDGFCGRAEHSDLAKKITDIYADMKVHQLRSTEQAILIGFNTALQDNPALSNRNWYGKNPVRIVIDLKGELPSTLTLFNDKIQTLVFTRNPGSHSETVTFLKVNNNKDFLDEVLSKLYDMKIHSVLVEGGPKTLHHFIQNKVWDEAHVFTSNKIWGEGIPSPKLHNSKKIYSKVLINDLYEILIPNY